MTEKQREIVKAHQHSAPVDITKLANALGLSVFDDETLETGISGMIYRDASGDSPAGYAISVNASEPYLRRRFTVAHECAHFLKHREKIGDGISDDPMYRSDKMNTQEEFEANNIAADLLMPRHLVHSLTRSGIVNLNELARRFQVSEAAMSIRMRFLHKAF